MKPLDKKSFMRWLDDEIKDAMEEVGKSVFDKHDRFGYGYDSGLVAGLTHVKKYLTGEE